MTKRKVKFEIFHQLDISYILAKYQYYTLCFLKRAQVTSILFSVGVFLRIVLVTRISSNLASGCTSRILTNNASGMILQIFFISENNSSDSQITCLDLREFNVINRKTNQKNIIFLTQIKFNSLIIYLLEEEVIRSPYISP